MRYVAKIVLFFSVIYSELLPLLQGFLRLRSVKIVYKETEIQRIAKNLITLFALSFILNLQKKKKEKKGIEKLKSI